MIDVMSTSLEQRLVCISFESEERSKRSCCIWILSSSGVLGPAVLCVSCFAEQELGVRWKSPVRSSHNVFFGCNLPL